MDRRVRELGVSGVPFFIFDGRVAVSGAQEPPALVAAMVEALERRTSFDGASTPESAISGDDGRPCPGVEDLMLAVRRMA